MTGRPFVVLRRHRQLLGGRNDRIFHRLPPHDLESTVDEVADGGEHQTRYEIQQGKDQDQLRCRLRLAEEVVDDVVTSAEADGDCQRAVLREVEELADEGGNAMRMRLRQDDEPVPLERRERQTRWQPRPGPV